MKKKLQNYQIRFVDLKLNIHNVKEEQIDVPPYFDIFFMKDIMKKSQEIIVDEAIILNDNELKEEAIDGCYFLAVCFFAHMLTHYEESLNYYQIIVEDNYPGVNVYIVSINTNLPENSLCIRVNKSIEELNDDTKIKAKEFLKEIRNISNLEIFYRFVASKVNQSLKNKDYVVKEK